MVVSRPMDEVAPVAALSLDDRRAHIRRRRRWLAVREWSGLLAVTAVVGWLATVVVLSLLGH